MNQTSASQQELARRLFERSSVQAQEFEQAVQHLEGLLQAFEVNVKDSEHIAMLAQENSVNLEKNSDRFSQLSHLFEAMSDFQDKLQKLSNLVGAIEKSTARLDNLALRSEKLSYNAEIESARAAEDSGRFSVVAEEIRNIASFNREVSREILDLVATTRMQVDTYAVEIKHSIGDGNDIINGVTRAFKSISDQTVRMADASTGIQSRSQDQIAKARTISETVKTQVEDYSGLVSGIIEDLTGTRITHLTVQDVRKRASEFVIIDVRTREEYVDELGHLENSQNIPINEDLESGIKDLDKAAPTLFVCRSGGRSTRAARIAQSLGFMNVFNMSGGMLAWNEMTKGE